MLARDLGEIYLNPQRSIENIGGKLTISLDNEPQVPENVIMSPS
jgi:hypothetical protein